MLNSLLSDSFELAQKLNRVQDFWGIMTFLSPTICLIILGLLKRLTYSKKYYSWSNDRKSNYNYNLARNYLNHKDNDRSEYYINLAISLNDNNHLAYNLRAYQKYLRKDYDSALVDSNKAIQLNSSVGVLYYRRGDIYLAQNDKSKACKDWNDAIKYGFEKAKERIEKFCI